MRRILVSLFFKSGGIGYFKILNLDIKYALKNKKVIVIYFINNNEITYLASFFKEYFRWNIFNFSKYKKQTY